MDWIELVERHCLGHKPSTQQIYRRIGKDFSQFCKEQNLDFKFLKYHHILLYLERLKAKAGAADISGHDRWTNKTIRRSLVVTKAIYTKNRLDPSIFDSALALVPVSLRPQKRRIGYVEFSKVLALFAACPATAPGYRNQAYMALGFGGGLRTSEALALRVGDIRQTEKGTIYANLQDTKTNQAAQQLIIPSLLRYLINYRDRRLSEGASMKDPLLTSYDNRGELPLNKSINQRHMQAMFEALTEKVLGKKMTPHSMRATAITKLISEGISHRKVQDFSRHSTVLMVEQYDKMLNDIDSSPAKKISFG